ncbi:hypothetical protein CesoFtcFv8_026679 [Champsocephalus esox]|uniref:Uncharacterized protein n=1 Tax=Champsocephalus esox TaxID=159716 RepID=A0AAN8G8Z2_9TELE|nr:hypothetical protein CesoFtcFv8_026679 [Champsocephalus esox]
MEEGRIAGRRIRWKGKRKKCITGDAIILVGRTVIDGRFDGLMGKKDKLRGEEAHTQLRGHCLVPTV